MTSHDNPATIWVTTEPTTYDRRVYVITLHLSPDRPLTLTPEAAQRYAAHVIDAAARAEYDAAIHAQLSPKMSDRLVAFTILEIRRARFAPDRPATAPLGVEPGLTAAGKPFLRLTLDEAPIGQWTPDAARSHAVHVLEAIAVAQHDATYRQHLVDTVGLADNAAVACVSDIRSHR